MYERQHMYCRECLVGGLVVLVYSCETAWLRRLDYISMHYKASEAQEYNSYLVSPEIITAWSMAHKVRILAYLNYPQKLLAQMC